MSITERAGYYISTYDSDNPGPDGDHWALSEFRNLYDFQIRDALRKLLSKGWDQMTLLIERKIGGEFIPIKDEEEDKYFSSLL